MISSIDIFINGVKVNFLDNLRLESKFEEFTVNTDQPIRYKGDGSAPSPFDYFLTSSVLCASYFVLTYCRANKIPTEDIHLSQNNIIDPENRYKQTLHIQVELPESISQEHYKGILNAIDRCTVKKVIQQGPEFKIEVVNSLGKDSLLKYLEKPEGTLAVFEQPIWTLDRVPTFDFDAAMTRASRKKTGEFVKQTGATLWIQHDPATNAPLKKAPLFYD